MFNTRWPYTNFHISIHALLAESDMPITDRIVVGFEFLSTLSLRRATGCTPASWSGFRDFYPRSPCGERQATYSSADSYTDFYPRSPCGERHALNPVNLYSLNFYPRSPCGERQMDGTDDITATLFLSTLSLRRATSICLYSGAVWQHFYPRSPCGERPGAKSTTPDRY